MNMPLFTAEASLYRTSKPYVMTAHRGTTQHNVVPQLPMLIGEVCGGKTPGGFGSCFSKCCKFYCESRYPFNCWKSSDCRLVESTCGFAESFGL